MFSTGFPSKQEPIGSKTEAPTGLNLHNGLEWLIQEGHKYPKNLQPKRYALN